MKLGIVRVEIIMRESVGKAVARELFYRQCLTSWLSEFQLRSGNFLLLLGEDSRELAFLDELIIPRDHVWSVENDYSVYCRQRESDLGVGLFYGNMNDYLAFLLHSNQSFNVLNLDIEGSYLSKLDKAMTPVLLFCWRNPETVVATYSSIGRDEEMLWEGVKSLAVFHWLAPQITNETLSVLTARYSRVGFTEPLRMALRDLFWLRSQMEHAILASAIIGLTSTSSAERFYRAGDMLWQAIVAGVKKPLRWQGIMDAVAPVVSGDPFKREILGAPLPIMGIGIKAQQHVVYNAKRPWSHRCYFAKYQSLPCPTSLHEWLEVSFAGMLSGGLTYINRRGKRQLIQNGRDDSLVHPRSVIWPNRDVYAKFRPRQISGIPSFGEFGSADETVRLIREHLQEGFYGAMQTSAATEIQSPVQPAPQARTDLQPEESEETRMNKVTTKKGVTPAYVKGGKFTEEGVARVRELAKKGCDSDTIAAEMPKDAPYQSIVAHVAVSRRGSK